MSLKKVQRFKKKDLHEFKTELSSLMTRPIYEITIDGEFFMKKNAWNTALRQVPKAVQSKLETGESAKQFFKEIKDLDQWTHESGIFKWSNDSTGQNYTVEIKKVK